MLAISCVCTLCLYALLCNSTDFDCSFALRMLPKMSSCHEAVTGTLYVFVAFAPSKLLIVPCGERLNDGR